MPIGGVVDVVRRGRFQATGTFMAAFAALVLLLLAAILGAIASIESLDLLGTTWQTAQSELVWVAAVVGTVLNAINQGDVILAGGEPNWLKIALTYCVPFCVATYGAYCAASIGHATP